ncbi:histone H2A protein 9 [Actinidia rufa]|uniref:Histone H2A protein 9 n=1 Tax=Actinidia rufa TaxID=165716 RepID=A0A7J0FPL9_9ERIC|nr:histone H2A protein 9 [Actinidia rufa]
MSGKGAKGLIMGKTPSAKDRDKKKPISCSSCSGLQAGEALLKYIELSNAEESFKKQKSRVQWLRDVQRVIVNFENLLGTKFAQRRVVQYNMQDLIISGLKSMFPRWAFVQWCLRRLATKDRLQA